jgi:hypothetical protein
MIWMILAPVAFIVAIAAGGLWTVLWMEKKSRQNPVEAFGELRYKFGHLFDDVEP